jgi:hypothetical protein
MEGYMKMLRCMVGVGMAAAALMGAAACGARPQGSEPCTLMVASNGRVSVRFGRREIGGFEPGLHEAVWRGASLAGTARRPEGEPGVYYSTIRAPGGTVVDVEIRVQQLQQGVAFAYRLTPREAIRLNSLHVTFDIPSEILGGGSFTADGENGSFPVVAGPTHVRSAPTKDLTIRTRAGQTLRLVFNQPTPVLLQDNRQWGPSFSIRIGPQMDGAEPWPAGKALDISFTLSSPGGAKVEYDQPVTLNAGSEWIPLDVELDVQPGSALDFSKIVPWHAPAGALGPVIATSDGHMAFAKRPNEPVRWYGVNLCFSAQYLTHDQADRLAERLRMLGYNAVRFHHYESELIDRSGGNSVTLNPQKLDQLDYLFAALKKRGIYMTTDLYVSRPVFAAEVWPGETGDVGMDEFKVAVPVNDRAFANYKAFATALLGHVNPYTGMTWAADPALAWLSLINEGNPGNFVGSLTPRLKADWVRAWQSWLNAKYPDASKRSEALGGANPTDPFPPSNDRAVVTFNVFLAENQIQLMERCRQFLGQLRCGALLTNMNAWTNPVQMQATRTHFGYVDDHFYVDHPEFVEVPWRLPSRCSNTSPVAAGAPGGRGCAALRLFDRPFTVSEFNYAGPSRFRGVGGILTGALGAIQDWSVIWRFAYCHSRESLFQPAPAGYFDVASDPLNLAAERASVCLFRRGDLRPAKSAVAIAATPDDVLKSPESARSAIANWNGLAWVTRIGYVPDTKARTNIMTLPLGWADKTAQAGRVTDPFANDAGEKILSEMRKRGWLPADNRTTWEGPVFQNDTGEVTVDAPADTLTLDTARTAGGYAPEGSSIRTKAVDVKITRTDATVWVSSVDNAPIASSKRLIITHLTDLQNSGVRYGDRDRRLLMDWGGLPHLVLNGEATVTLRLKNPANAKVWALSLGGKRLGQVPAKVENGALVIPLSVNAGGKARMLYEVEVGP